MENQIVIENINTSKKLGVALKRLRKLKGFTQADLAEKVNIRQATVSDAENGKGNIDTFIKLIQALKVNMALSNTSVCLFKWYFGWKTKQANQWT